MSGKVAVKEAPELTREHSANKRKEHTPPGSTPKPSPEGTLPQFPELAWRGIFADYRDAMQGTTEASDSVHYATLVASVAASAGRSVKMFIGDWVFPNCYISFFGTTGDRKTTAQRRAFAFKLLPTKLRVIKAVGSTEGLAQELAPETGTDDGADAEMTATTTVFFYVEELSAMLTRAGWGSSTLKEFFVELFDCPTNYTLKYVKNPVDVFEPTPTMLCGTTPSWFWKNTKPEDFFGGFGNRFLFFTGEKKPPIAFPRKPDEEKLALIRKKLVALHARTETTEAVWSRQAAECWRGFYEAWEQKRRPELLAAAVKRIPTYAAKIAMLYASVENTLPEVRRAQLEAAIAVAEYCAACAEKLLDERIAAIATPQSELEKKMVKWVKEHSGYPVRKMQMTFSKYCAAKQFNETLLNLERAGRIATDENGAGRVVRMPEGFRG